MQKTLDYCRRNKKISSIYCDKNETGRHFTGYIAGLNESELLIAHISAHGYYDGYILKRTDDVYRVDYDGEYERKIEKLYNIKNQSHPGIDAVANDEEALLYSLLDYAMNNDLIISAEFDDSYLSGFVSCCEGGLLHMEIVNDCGVREGTAVIDVNEVLTIAIDTDDEQDIKSLMRI